MPSRIAPTVRVFAPCLALGALVALAGCTPPGVIEPDGVTPVIDAGESAADAATDAAIDDDAGTAIDAGSGEDAGALDVDAGSSTEEDDAGRSSDGGIVTMDAGAAPDAGVRVDAGTPIYPSRTGPGWSFAFADEFNGRPCDPFIRGSCPAADAARVAACFGTGNVSAPANLQHKMHAGPSDTVREVHPHLLDLDKCVWSVSDHVNWIHFTGDNHEFVVAQHTPERVRVGGGELLLGTAWVGGAGPCGTNADHESGVNQHCPYVSANLTTIPFHGLSAAFPKASGTYAPGDGLVLDTAGFIEIRAKMPYENGNMAALWTWAAEAGPQFEHEHDILEYFTNWRENHHQGDVNYLPGGVGGRGSWVLSNATTARIRFEEFHVYSMEWEQGNMLRYLFDGIEVARVTDGDIALTTGNECRPLEVRGNAFYLWFWNILMTYWYAPAAAPAGAGQPPDWLHVDWVRVSKPCTLGTPGCAPLTGPEACRDPCGGYGVWTDGNCLVGSAPSGKPANIVNGQYAYIDASSCGAGEPRVANACLLGTPPPGRTPLIAAGQFAVAPVCRPSTPERYNCARPCPWSGTTADAHGCLWGTPPAGRNAFVWDNGFYYDAATTNPATACPDGGVFDSVHCFLGKAPQGAIAEFADGRYYLQPEHCAYGGTWDATKRACLFLAPPAGRNAFTYGGSAYYTAATTTPRCGADAAFDTVNCRVGPIPPGADAFTADNKIWLAETCRPVTSAETIRATITLDTPPTHCP